MYTALWRTSNWIVLHLILINNISELLKSAMPRAEEKTADYINLKFLSITQRLINKRMKNLSKLGQVSPWKVKINFFFFFFGKQLFCHVLGRHLFQNSMDFHEHKNSAYQPRHSILKSTEISNLNNIVKMQIVSFSLFWFLETSIWKFFH